MSELTRDTINPQLTQALGAKGGGASLSLGGQLLPVVTCYDLEQSPWPEFLPVSAWESIAAVAGNFSSVALWLDAASAPPHARLVIDAIDFTTGDGTGWVDAGIQPSSILGIGPRTPQLRDGRGVAVGYQRAPSVFTGGRQVAGKALTWPTTAWRHYVTAANAWHQVRYPTPVVLYPGFAFLLEPPLANFAVTAVFYARLFNA